MMKRLSALNKGFTLLEIIIVVAVILSLSTVSLYGYTQLIEKSRHTVCTTNLNALHNAVKQYFFDHDAFPSVLGDLEPAHIRKGYEIAFNHRDVFTKFAYLFLSIGNLGEAYAQFLTYENLSSYGASKSSLSCPSDENGGVSYGINGNLINKKWSEINDDDIIIADCDSLVFNNVDQLSGRHGSQSAALAITKGRTILKFETSSTSDNANGGNDDTDEKSDDKKSKDDDLKKKKDKNKKDDNSDDKAKKS